MAGVSDANAKYPTQPYVLEAGASGAGNDIAGEAAARPSQTSGTQAPIGGAQGPTGFSNINGIGVYLQNGQVVARDAYAGPNDVGSAAWYQAQIAQRQQQAQGNTEANPSMTYAAQQQVAAQQAQRSGAFAADLNLPVSQKDYLSRPDIYNIAGLGDTRTQQLIGSGVSPIDALNRQAAEAQAAGNARAQNYYLNEASKVAQTYQGLSSAYHHAAMDSGLPTAINPYEYLGDTALTFQKRLQENEWNRAINVYNAENGLAPVPYTQLDLNPNIRELNQILATGTNGLYQNLGSPYVSEGSRFLTLEEQQRIGQLAISSPYRGPESTTGIDTMASLTPENVAARTGFKPGSFMQTAVNPGAGQQAPPAEQALGGNIFGPLTVSILSPGYSAIKGLRSFKLPELPKPPESPLTNGPTEADKQFATNLMGFLGQNKVAISGAGVVGQVAYASAPAEMGLPALFDLGPVIAAAPELVPAVAVGAAALGVPALEWTIKEQQAAARGGGPGSAPINEFGSTTEVAQKPQYTSDLTRAQENYENQPVVNVPGGFNLPKISDFPQMPTVLAPGEGFKGEVKAPGAGNNAAINLPGAGLDLLAKTGAVAAGIGVGLGIGAGSIIEMPRSTILPEPFISKAYEGEKVVSKATEQARATENTPYFDLSPRSTQKTAEQEQTKQSTATNYASKNAEALDNAYPGAVAPALALPGAISGVTGVAIFVPQSGTGVGSLTAPVTLPKTINTGTQYTKPTVNIFDTPTAGGSRGSLSKDLKLDLPLFPSFGSSGGLSGGANQKRYFPKTELLEWVARTKRTSKPKQYHDLEFAAIVKRPNKRKK